MIIGICGKSNSGKSDCCQFLMRFIENKKYLVVNLSFAEKLIQRIEFYYNVDVQQIDCFKRFDKFRISQGKNMREILRSEGNHMRANNPDIFINEVLEQIDVENAQVTIVRDIRFKKEYNELKNYANMKKYKFCMIRMKSDNPDKSISEIEQLQFPVDFQIRYSQKSNFIKKLKDYVYEILEDIQTTKKNKAEEIDDDNLSVPEL